MKTLTDYTSDAISAAMEKYGAFFAFSNAQFEEKKVDGITYTQNSSGMIAPKENFKTLVQEIDKIYEDGIKQDIEENGIKSIIKRELRNYECYYTGEIDNAVDALEDYGITYEQVLNVYRGLEC